MANSKFLLILCILPLLMAMAAATQYRVGGSASWTVPANPNTMSFNRWAERNRFQIGDSLLFVYPPDKDSVLQVTQDAYNTCNTSSFIHQFDDGNTVFTFHRSGLYYFISGKEANCRRNESMVVVVMADRSNRASLGSTISPTMAPSPPPPAANLTSSPPSPPPSLVEAMPPPPAVEVAPALALPNSASLKVVGFMSSVGTLLGAILLVF